MSPDEAALVAGVLDDFVAVNHVPPDFEQNVRHHIATRPSPNPGISQLDRIEQKLDQLLSSLGGS